jgi:hypothetical protein
VPETARTVSPVSPVTRFEPLHTRTRKGVGAGDTAVTAVTPSRVAGTPTIRQNPMVAKRALLNEVDKAVAAAEERVIARRDRARALHRDVRPCQ